MSYKDLTHEQKLSRPVASEELRMKEQQLKFRNKTNRKMKGKMFNRLKIATALMAGCMPKSMLDNETLIRMGKEKNCSPQTIVAQIAISYADALIKELEK